MDNFPEPKVSLTKEYSGFVCAELLVYADDHEPHGTVFTASVNNYEIHKKKTMGMKSF